MADEDALAREIAHLRADLRDDLLDIKSEIGARVRSDIYQLQHEAVLARVSALEAERARDADRHRATRRWVIGVVVVPVVMTVVQILLSLRGSS